jgi:hypothetical protein
MDRKNGRGVCRGPGRDSNPSEADQSGVVSACLAHENEKFDPVEPSPNPVTEGFAPSGCTNVPSAAILKAALRVSRDLADEEAIGQARQLMHDALKALVEGSVADANEVLTIILSLLTSPEM